MSETSHCNYQEAGFFAQRYHVSRQTIIGLAKKGLPCIRVGRKFLFDPVEVESYFRQQARQEGARSAM